MSQVNLKTLISKNNKYCKRTLEGAAGLCLSRTHQNVEIEHWLMKLIEEPTADINLIFGYYSVSLETVVDDINKYLENQRTGSDETPAFSTHLVKVLNEAWAIASLEFSDTQIRSVYILMSVLSQNNALTTGNPISAQLDKIDLAHLKLNFNEIIGDSSEQPLGANSANQSSSNNTNSKTPALDQFTVNLTQRARDGKIDPVIGRDDEVRQIIDILSRRRQNNPILTGEAGVGKTAVVEGFANKVVAGEVPPSLQNIELRTLDLALLQAGAGVKGEFENRLKDVIKEVQSSATPIIIFIDEAHTLIGAGGTAGQGDAANLIKPALARGELRTIAATTWAEYKKYFEKDPALARRFQVVKIEEPSTEKAIQMLRGLSGTMMKHHSVDILNEAVIAAVQLSDRYITGRQLPDKAIGLLDTACARVQLSQAGVPARIEELNYKLFKNKTELTSLERENIVTGEYEQQIQDIQEDDIVLEKQLSELQTLLESELALVKEISAVKDELKEQFAAQEPDQDKIKTLAADLKAKQTQLSELQNNQPMVFESVDAQVIAEVVADWTGIPVGRMQSDEVQGILDLEDRMRERVVGQDHALKAITKIVQTSKAKLTDPSRPIGVFMLAGTSGVGKTETALTLAENVYGSEANVTVINMSEFKEEHKVSLLLGSPPGYVGYGEGGILTEAVRRKPYSVVLLDEMEKAHPGVHDIFFQVFDKGMLKDGEGRDIDFKNCIIIMTSNVGTDTIMNLKKSGQPMPDEQGLSEAIRDDLLGAYKPAFLGRIKVIPYLPLEDDVLLNITKIQLGKLSKRVKDNYSATLTFTDEVAINIVQRCTEVDSGARNIYQIINNTILPDLSEAFLNKMLEEGDIDTVTVSVGEGEKANTFEYEFVMV
ncbi:type VI secretion system ATPase TssH [Marinicellulosiphila megalodicopiae]|uniref:type VI secretion system ATPase TssH n=1 Tax=Marinicellulosiphila megalodicopiae TaxID=2724896 RepID=UPI003BB19CAE